VNPPPRDESPRHPSAARLDAVAAGDTDASVDAHLVGCEACRRYVETLRGEAARFRSGHDAKEFIARVRKRSARSTRERRWSRAAWTVAPLLAAAIVLLVVRARPPASGSSGGGVEPPGTTLPETHFKGGLVVAVVRERAGHQDRLTGPFQVRANDRIRVELSNDQEGGLSAGLLTDEGEWVPLLAPTTLEAGTHYSELAARFDESPTSATLLAGEPGAVDRARRTRDFAGVVAWRVTSEPAP
jgi:hypothetical protein